MSPDSVGRGKKKRVGRKEKNSTSRVGESKRYSQIQLGIGVDGVRKERVVGKKREVNPEQVEEARKMKTIINMTATIRKRGTNRTDAEKKTHLKQRNNSKKNLLQRRGMIGSGLMKIAIVTVNSGLGKEVWKEVKKIILFILNFYLDEWRRISEILRIYTCQTSIIGEGRVTPDKKEHQTQGLTLQRSGYRIAG